MQDRRIYERFDLSVPARVAPVDGPPGRDVLNLTTQNISAGGAYFRTLKPIPRGLNIRLEITLPLNKLKRLKGAKKALVSLTGKVIRSDPGGMAVQFNEDYHIVPARQ